MRHRIEAGTDSATLCAFDPAALPRDFDARVSDDPMGLMEALRDQGRLWVGGTGADGRHSLEVRVNESEPAAPAQWNGRIEVPSGALWVCGAEFMARDPEQGSAFTPEGGLGRYRMGARIVVPPGRYSLAVHAARGPGPQRILTGQWRPALGRGLVLLGGLAAVVTGVALTIAAVLKTVQWLMSNPLATSGLNALAPLLMIFAAGLLAVLAGRRLAARGTHSQARPAGPDLILTLTPGSAR